MDSMSEPSDRDEARPDQPESTAERSLWQRAPRTTPTRRALLLTALGGLLIAGLTMVLPFGEHDSVLTSYLEPTGVSARSNSTFQKAVAGDCLTWPENAPDQATIVDCAEDHRFEVAESVDMGAFPGAEYGPDAAPPSPARIQQISQEQCQAAVQRYLGPKFDPNSRFAVSMLWAGDKAWKQSGERRMLCGLQAPGPDNQQLATKGKVAEVDQSKVWPAGTCLGIDPASNQPIDVPVDCAAPHAMEITGIVNLAEKFPDALPAEADQDLFIKDACTRLTDAFLAPIQLRTTTLTLIYSTVSLPSWTAGSRQVACSVGATLGNGAWATLLNSAKGPLLINGQPPVPPPDIPADRLNLPPVPLPDPSAQSGGSSDTSGSYSSGSSSSGSSSGSSSSGSSSSGGGSSQNGSGQQNQHLPQQATQAPATQQAPPPQQQNTFNPPAPDAPAPVAPAPAPAPVPPPGDVLPAGPAPGPADLPPA